MAAPNVAAPAGAGDPEAEGRRERQVAQRVFAAEFNQAAHHVKEEGTYGPSFVVSPYGETAKHSMLRLDAMREALQMEPAPTQKKLEELGFSKEVAEGVVRAIEHYGKPEIVRQTAVVRDALESLLPGGSGERISAEPSFA